MKRSSRLGVLAIAAVLGGAGAYVIAHRAPAPVGTAATKPVLSRVLPFNAKLTTGIRTSGRPITITNGSERNDTIR